MILERLAPCKRDAAGALLTFVVPEFALVRGST